MAKKDDLYSENFDLLYQTNSITEFVYEDLQKIELADSDTRKIVSRCIAALSILPDKLRRLELISDERLLIEKEGVAC